MNISDSIPAFMKLRKRKEMLKSVLILLTLTAVNLVSAIINQTIKMANKENEIVLKFSRISEKAYTPEKGSERAAGYDLKSAYDMVIPAHGKQLIPTDLKIELPPGCYGRIAPRSGLAWKNFIDVGAGVIDEDYRGNVGVVLFNHSADDFHIKSGDRIAQLICERIYNPILMEIKDLNNTERGERGFGSTGLQ